MVEPDDNPEDGAPTPAPTPAPEPGAPSSPDPPVVQTSAPDPDGAPRRRKRRTTGHSRNQTPWSAIRHDFITHEGLTIPELLNRWHGKTWRGRVVELSMQWLEKRATIEGWQAARDAHLGKAAELALADHRARLSKLYDVELEELLADLRKVRRQIFDSLSTSLATPMSDAERGGESTETSAPMPGLDKDGKPTTATKTTKTYARQERAPFDAQIARDIVRYSVELLAANLGLQAGDGAGERVRIE